MQVLNRLKSRIAKYLYSGNYAPGHFYSPIPDRSYVRQHENEIFDKVDIRDVDLNEKGQLNFLRESMSTYHKFPFQPQAVNGYRYYTENSFFNATDGLSLFLMLHRYMPKRIIEVGSGFSSACMLDTFDKHLGYHPSVTFIEPFPDRLRSLLGEADLKKHTLIESIVQQVPLSVFETLEANDILFIDSSHVSKVGSDLNHILFQILPVLKRGVIIHFHDICFPFEYPKDWIYEGIYWNEAYLVRALLMNNPAYEIVLFNHYLATQHRAWLAQEMPRFNSGGSLWLRKL